MRYHYRIWSIRLLLGLILLVPRSGNSQTPKSARTLVDREIAVAVPPDLETLLLGTVIGVDSGWIQLRTPRGEVAQIAFSQIQHAQLRVKSHLRWQRACSGAALGAAAGGLAYYMLNQGQDHPEYIGLGAAIIGIPMGAAVGFAVGYTTSLTWTNIRITP